MKNIVLTGFMASGKTTVGMSVAKKLNLMFYDTDKIIEEQERVRQEMERQEEERKKEEEKREKEKKEQEEKQKEKQKEDNKDKQKKGKIGSQPQGDNV